MKKLLIIIGSIGLIGFIGLICPNKTYAAASLSLSPATASKAVNDTFNVDIILDTGGEAISGATAIITYDTTKLQVQDNVSVIDPACTTSVNITPGSIFSTPLTNCVDSSASTIRFDSGSLGTAYTGRGTMATISFRALAAGNAAVNFTFNPSSTTNTSLVAAAASPTNILTTVNNGVYTIGTTTTTTTTTTTPPVTGALENTLMAIGAGVFFILTGFLLSKFNLSFRG